MALSIIQPECSDCIYILHYSDNMWLVLFISNVAVDYLYSHKTLIFMGTIAYSTNGHTILCSKFTCCTFVSVSQVQCRNCFNSNTTVVAIRLRVILRSFIMAIINVTLHTCNSNFYISNSSNISHKFIHFYPNSLFNWWVK